jgi:N-acetylmuramoyl-L-alanine amidase
MSFNPALRLLVLAVLALACGRDENPKSASRLTSRAGPPPAGALEPDPAPVDSPVVAIDPGHPSETSGGTVQHGVAEVHVAWEVAERLRDILRARGYRVVMTKDREAQNVANEERAGISNRAGARLMVRLHCDAASGSGFALYYPDRQGTVRGVTGPGDSVIAWSHRAATALHTGMAATLGPRLRDGGIHGDSRTFVGARQGALTGSIFSRVPVVTIEMVVLTNRADAEFIAGEEGQRLMAEAIATGIERFVPLGPEAAGASDHTPRS